MTKDQTRSMEITMEVFSKIGRRKYKAGQKEHSGNLWQKPIDELLFNLFEEGVDIIHYSCSSLQKLGYTQDQILKYFEENRGL